MGWGRVIKDDSGSPSDTQPMVLRTRDYGMEGRKEESTLTVRPVPLRHTSLTTHPDAFTPFTPVNLEGRKCCPLYPSSLRTFGSLTKRRPRGEPSP